MKSMDDLRSEHEAVRLMLRILDKFAVGLERGMPSETEDGAAMLDFLRTFVDRCHHAKEEEHLFPLAERMRIPAGPEIGTLRREHREARAFVNGMDDALAGWSNGDVAAKGIFASNFRSYDDLMRRHTDNEDDLLFPEMESVMTREQDAELAQCFAALERERIGAGKYNEYHRLLESLERKYLGPPEPQRSPPVHRSTLPGERHGESL
jgi:hemerythrin-like domain-containing protein